MHMEFVNNNDFLNRNWKWLLILGLILVSFVVVPALRKGFYKLRLAISRRKINDYVKALLELPLEKPITGLLLALLWQWTFHSLELHPKTETPLVIITQIFQAFFLIQLAYLATEAVGEWLKRAAAKTETRLDDQLVPLARKSLKVLVLVLGVLITLQNFGLNVVSLLAGLGLGGLALALAAQDTAANLFGSITILADRPFQVGDVIKVADVEGVVEDVGFRSTTIRAPNRTLVTIPNSTVAKEKIENITYKTATRIRHILGITYDTSPDRMEAFVQAIRYYLYQQPKVIKEDLRVYFNNMGDFNLQVLVQCYLATVDPNEELALQQEILLEIMRIAQNLDVAFAFPTQTLHLESLPKA